jgi:hypothetical protein
MFGWKTKNELPKDIPVETIYLLDRWLCYHFPVVEDVCEHLLKISEGENVPHLWDFRNELIKKYGDQSNQRKDNK